VDQEYAHRLLAEVEDLIRTMPPRASIHHEEHTPWFGRARAVIARWNPYRAPLFDFFYGQFVNSATILNDGGGVHLQKAIAMLHEARHDLLLQLPNAGTTVVQKGGVYEYFEALRGIITLAKLDAFFVDPYLDADFISKYLPSVDAAVTVRLLGQNKILALVAAVDMFVLQTPMKVEVRSSPSLHDRFLMVDRHLCYQSGASFKDGAKSAPAILNEITDAADTMIKTYENIWQGATVYR
jgi:hypothetical protein